MEQFNPKFNPEKRQVMSIINITPDSFFDGSRTLERESIIKRVQEAIDAGATILDIGGYSSRPGAAEVSLEGEWGRVDMGLEAVRSVSQSVIVSVDTFRAEIVRRAVDRYGVIVVNDIMAGEGDDEMFNVVAERKLPYIAMHMRGTPETMLSLINYSRGVVEEVAEYFRGRIKLMRQAGIESIILDPGFGFAKSLEQNYQLLAGLSTLCELGCPLLVGLSRKSMIYRALGVEPADALAGTIALQWEALRQGASILRVHDTREAVESVKLFEIYDKYINGGGL